jgi:hypothetical protein
MTQGVRDSKIVLTRLSFEIIEENHSAECACLNEYE